MAKQRSSFAKLQRDKAKKERAANKRAQRRDRKDVESEVAVLEEDTDAVSLVAGKGEPSPGELLTLVEDLHKRLASGQITEEEFEEAKVELFARLQS